MIPALKPIFLEFFDGVSDYVSSNVRPWGLGHKETACTDDLLMCLSRDQPPPYLPYNAAALCQNITDALAEMELEEAFSFSCTARGFTQNHEGAITQSDYAIRLRVRDNSSHNSRDTTSSVFFFQAKVRKESGYDRDVDQEEKIMILRRFIGESHLSYSLYNPQNDGGIMLAHDPWAQDACFTYWSHFMADWVTGSIQDDESFGDHGAWLRNALIEVDNTEANDFIAEKLKTKNKKWTPYVPALIDIGIELPAYTLENRPPYGGPQFGSSMFGSSNNDEP